MGSCALLGSAKIVLDFGPLTFCITQSVHIIINEPMVNGEQRTGSGVSWGHGFCSFTPQRGSVGDLVILFGPWIDIVLCLRRDDGARRSERERNWWWWWWFWVLVGPGRRGTPRVSTPPCAMARGFSLFSLSCISRFYTLVHTEHSKRGSIDHQGFCFRTYSCFYYYCRCIIACDFYNNAPRPQRE